MKLTMSYVVLNKARITNNAFLDAIGAGEIADHAEINHASAVAALSPTPALAITPGLTGVSVEIDDATVMKVLDIYIKIARFAKPLIAAISVFNKELCADIKALGL